MAEESADSQPAEPKRAVNDGFTEGGDLIFRSSDGIDFRVHSIVLSLATPAFSDLRSTGTQREVVKLGETSEVVALMLGFIYPKPPPIISSFELLGKAMAASNRYQLQGMKAQLRERLSLISSSVSVYTDPLSALSVASSNGFREEADLAALIASKRHNFQNVDDVLKLVDAAPSAAALLKLIAIPAVTTQILADVLFSFHKAPMRLFGDEAKYILCGYCQRVYHNVCRHSPPEWQARWAYWVFSDIKDLPVEKWDEFFQISFFNSAFYRSGVRAIPTGLGGNDCICFGMITQNAYYFEKWASTIHQHLKSRMSNLDKLQFPPIL